MLFKKTGKNGNIKEPVMFDRIIVIGAGTVARKCAKLLRKKDIDILFIESENSDSLSAQNFCNRNNINYVQFSKDKLTEFFSKIVEKTLIISASNRYLFPSLILSKPNIKVINYHGALSPKYPGRNAEAWAIYNGDKNGGITWHYVVKEVDAGDIIIQETVPIGIETTSFSLLREYSKLAIVAFNKIINSVLNETAFVVEQVSSERHPIRYSWHIPNNGELNLDWNESKMSEFLRAMDYGPLSILGEPFFNYQGKKYEFSKYEINAKPETGPLPEIELSELSLLIKKQNCNIKLSQLKILKKLCSAHK